MFHIGKRITYLRNQHNLSQQILADFTFNSRGKISKIEVGSSELTLDLAQDLSNVFNVPKEYFISSRYKDEVANLSDRLFGLIIMDKESDLPMLLEKIYDLPLEQELELELLRAAWWIKKGEIETIRPIIENFLALFVDESNLEQFSQRQKIFFYMYAYERFYDENNLKEAYRCCIELLNLVESKTYRGSLLMKISKLSHNSHNYGQAFLEIEKALEALIEVNEPYHLARSYLIRSATCINLKLYDEANLSLNKLFSLATEHDIRDFIALTYQHRGYILTQSNKFSQAALHYKKALEYVEKKEALGQILNSLIKAEIKCQNYAMAKERIKEARKIFIREYEQIILTSYEAEIYLYEGKLKEHKYRLKKSISYFEKNKHLNDMEYVYGYLAVYHAEKGHYKEASNYFLKREGLRYES